MHISLFRVGSSPQQVQRISLCETTPTEPLLAHANVPFAFIAGLDPHAAVNPACVSSLGNACPTLWRDARVYPRMLARARSKQPFILLDGPPYANGSLHAGHILNKVIKDIILKAKGMAGHYVPFIPGFDCHGQPLELKAIAAAGYREPPFEAGAGIAIRASARRIVEEYIALQSAQAQAVGCFGAWESPYTTMSNAYQARTIEAFATLLAQGLLYRADAQAGTDSEYRVTTRVEKQWFLSVESSGLRDAAIHACEALQGNATHAIRTRLADRPDWCISRQHHWGIPIFAYECHGCHETVTSPDFVRTMAARVAAEGSDFWFAATDDVLPADAECPHCHGTGTLERTQSVFDVWFDAGAAFIALAQDRLGLDCDSSADLVLEGNDQVTGWFQKLILLGLAVQGQLPMRKVLMHNMVIAENGGKLSKSAGNALAFDTLLETASPDGLRLWALGGLEQNRKISEALLKKAATEAQDIHHLLIAFQNLAFSTSHWNPATDLLSHEALPPNDLHVLRTLNATIRQIRGIYKRHDFGRLRLAINQFRKAASQHLEHRKKRLYNDWDFNSAATVLWHTADVMMRLLAPVLSFTMETAWQDFPYPGEKPRSVFLTELPQARPEWDSL